MKQKKKITKKQDFAKICKGAYCFGRDLGCDTSNSPEQQCHRELNNVTASVTCDPKCAKIRKYWPREELGSSASRAAGMFLFFFYSYSTNNYYYLQTMCSERRQHQVQPPPSPHNCNASYDDGRQQPTPQ